MKNKNKTQMYYSNLVGKLERIKHAYQPDFTCRQLVEAVVDDGRGPDITVIGLTGARTANREEVTRVLCDSWGPVFYIDVDDDQVGFTVPEHSFFAKRPVGMYPAHTAKLYIHEGMSIYKEVREWVEKCIDVANFIAEAKKYLSQFTSDKQAMLLMDVVWPNLAKHLPDYEMFLHKPGVVIRPRPPFYPPALEQLELQERIEDALATAELVHTIDKPIAWLE